MSILLCGFIPSSLSFFWVLGVPIDVLFEWRGLNILI